MIVGTIRPFSGHYSSQLFTEIGRDAGAVVDAVEFKAQRQFLERVGLSLGDFVGFNHLVENDITA